MAGSGRISHRRASRRLLATVLILWAIVGLGVHLFASTSNETVFLGFPVGFFFAALAAPLLLVLLVLSFARRQNVIDEDYGMAED